MYLCLHVEGCDISNVRGPCARFPDPTFQGCPPGEPVQSNWKGAVQLAPGFNRWTDGGKDSRMYQDLPPSQCRPQKALCLQRFHQRSQGILFPSSLFSHWLLNQQCWFILHFWHFIKYTLCWTQLDPWVGSRTNFIDQLVYLHKTLFVFVTT